VGSTIAGNRIDSGLPAIGGANVSVVAMGPGCPSLARVRNSVIAGGGAAGNCSDNVQSIGHNVDSDGTCHFDLASDRSGADPKLAALADNGGPTDTIALREGSPAIDLGADCSANDQRGIAHTLGGGCDAGAFESPFTAPIPAAPAPAAAPAPVTTTVTVAPPARAR